MISDKPKLLPVPEVLEPRWLETSADFDQWLDQYPDLPLALDTEFERVTTFHPIPGLVQVGLGDALRLVEPEVAAASRRFRETLTDPTRPKILYAMGEDLELFRYWLELEPRGMLDLQIGAALAGAGFSMGYARLVENLFGETLDKSLTRSDWLARPLTHTQQRYALDDVRFLPALFDWVLEQLQDKNLTDALVEESERFAAEQLVQADPEHWYLRVRGGWYLSPEQQGVLRALVRWREYQCRDRDLPRNRILADSVLIALAEQQPATLNALSAIEDMPPVVVRRYGEYLLGLIADTLASEVTPELLIERPLSRTEQDRFRKIKRLLQRVAENAEVPVEILAPRRRLEALVRNGPGETDAWRVFTEGWRGRLTESVIHDIRTLLAP